jgi:transcriptional regulator with XRE-family HTH domain
MSPTESQIRRAIGEELRATRRASGLTQKELAARLNCRASDIAAMERGVRRIEAAYLVRLAQGMNVDPKGLLTRILQRAGVL